MQLFNWSGAVFGPGSEWLWACLQFIVVVVSLAGIYRQLRLQGAANSIALTESLERQWASPQMTYSRLELLMRLRAGKVDMTSFGIALDLISFFTVVARLERTGAISIDAVTEDWGEAIITWSSLLAPTMQAAGLPVDLGPLVARVRQNARERGIAFPDADVVDFDQRIAWARRDLARDYAIQRGEMPPSPEPAPDIAA